MEDRLSAHGAEAGGGAGAAGGPRALVLGIAQDAGYPQAGCRGECCRPAWEDPSRRRHAASLALVDGSPPRRWLIDATPDVREQLRALDLACPVDAPAPGLDGIFLTHAHFGHVTGLLQLGKEVMGARGVPVYALPRLAAYLREAQPYAALVEGGHIAPRELVAGEWLALSPNLALRPISVPHRAEHSETAAFQVRGPGRTLLYLPDIDGWDQAEAEGLPLESLLAEVDLAFLDATFFSADELPGRDLSKIPHPLVVDTLARLRAMGPGAAGKVVLTHLNHSNPLLAADHPARASLAAASAVVAEEGGVWHLG